MANKNLFQTQRGALVPQATTQERCRRGRLRARAEGGTGPDGGDGDASAGPTTPPPSCNSSACSTLPQVDVDFLARTALYARRKGFMKDMPALLCAVLATRDLDRFAEIFRRSSTTGRCSGTLCRCSAPASPAASRSAPRRAPGPPVAGARDRTPAHRCQRGQRAFLADVVKMVHPRPADATREAFYAWLLGKPYDPAVLPAALQRFEDWKTTRTGEIPTCPSRCSPRLS